MRIIARSTLSQYWKHHRDAEMPLRAWLAEATAAAWTTPQELKAQYGNASILKNSRAVFNIAGNKHRLIVGIDYGRGIVFIKFVGTHREYDRIDVETVELRS